MAVQIFSEKDGYQFYSILFNELNSVKNSESNALDLMNLLEYVGSKVEEVSSGAVNLLQTLKKVSFSNVINADDVSAIEDCLKIVFNDKCKKIEDVFENFDIKYLVSELVKFIKTDIFSQYNDMNEVSLSCVNFLNQSFESVIFKVKYELSGAPVEVKITPEIPANNKIHKGTNILIQITNSDVANYAAEKININSGEVDFIDNYDSVSGKLEVRYSVFSDCELLVKFKSL